MMYHSKGKDYFIVNNKVIWNCLDDEHKKFISDLVEKFNAQVKFIKSGDKVFFSQRKK